MSLTIKESTYSLQYNIGVWVRKRTKKKSIPKSKQNKTQKSTASTAVVTNQSVAIY